MMYFVQGRIDDKKGYNVPFSIVLFSDVKKSENENRTIGPLYEDIYHQLKKEIQSDERNIDFKHFYIESIEEMPKKWVENYQKF